MQSTFTTMAAAAAVCALVALPAAAQSSGSGSAGSGSSQQGGSSSGSGATDQRGSTHGDQAGSTGSGQSGAGQTGTSGQSGTGQSGTSTDPSAGTEGRSGDSRGATQDRTFIVEAAAGGMAEVELGRLATQKASRSEVKEFGQMMVDDHGKANDKLMKIAQEKGLAAPHALKPDAKEAQDRLSKLSGEAFDRAYMQHMVKDHQKDIALFRKHSTGASDSDVKQFASATLPNLEKHLRRAQEIVQLVGGGDTPRGTTGSSPGAGSGTSGSGSSGGGVTPPR
jgi:putative membrane protein